MDSFPIVLLSVTTVMLVPAFWLQRRQARKDNLVAHQQARSLRLQRLHRLYRLRRRALSQETRAYAPSQKLSSS